MMRSIASVLPLSLLVACTVPMASPSAPSAAPDQVFFVRLSALCGKAFDGRLVSSDAADADMASSPMVMHVRTCSGSEIRIPFHVQRKDGSWDRSRTWVVTRTATGLRLKHDHRHADGSADPVTLYGGDTATPGSAMQQDFPVDAESIALFRKQGLARSITNVWTIELDATRYAYVLRRTGENARHFRVEFDLTRPVAPPPPPWGAD